jgi:hypothetical protein
MSRFPTGGNGGNRPRTDDRRPFESPAGVRMLFPGWSQYRWGQRDRGRVLSGSFVIAVLVGIWTWGTWLSWGILSFAFFTHVASTTDVLRQRSFPAYPSRTALAVVAGTLGLLLYLPVFCTLSLIAWPGFDPDGAGSGFLVNLRAYRDAAPRQGQWVWMRPQPTGKPRAAHVVAVSGQEVEWTGRAWKIDGRGLSAPPHLRLAVRPQACRFKVPANQILVEPRENGLSSDTTGPLVLVAPDRIIGRAWAQFYPVWDRRLL